MNHHVKLAVLFLILNFKNVFAQTTPMVTPKQLDLASQYEIMKKLSEEIKDMNLPYVEVEQQQKRVNVSLSAVKFQRVTATGDLSKIKFKLYNRNNTVNPRMCTASAGSLRDCGFDAAKELKMIIHGWMLNSLYQSCIDIKNSYLKFLDVNIIMVDWASVGQGIYYPCVAAQTKTVGWRIGAFLNVLINFGCSPVNIHIVGHSLGPHIAAFAAEITIGKVGRITALDPALPGFVLNTLSQFGGAGRLLPNHAEFVDVIHSNGGTLGMVDAVGHVDFYPNGGQIQPGCWLINFLCSHYRAYDLWNESIGKSVFPAKPCDPNPGQQREVLMGEPVPKTARGRYCLNTNGRPPYGIVQKQSMRRAQETKPKLEPDIENVADIQSGSAALQIKSLYVYTVMIIVNASFWKQL